MLEPNIARNFFAVVTCRHWSSTLRGDHGSLEGGGVLSAEGGMEGGRTGPLGCQKGPNAKELSESLHQIRVSHGISHASRPAVCLCLGCPRITKATIRRHLIVWAREVPCEAHFKTALVMATSG